MSLTRQLRLFSADSGLPARRAPLDPESERLLDVYRRTRLAEGAHHRSAEREASQLRSLAREAGAPHDPLPLRTLLDDPAQIARVLIEPARTIARSTGKARLLAVQRFVRLIGPLVGRDAAADLCGLDALLPAVHTNGWHAAGTLVAGEPSRRRGRGPTLDGDDLLQIIGRAAVGQDHLRRARDRALVAVQCFSGLRPEELVALRWEDLEWTRMDSGYIGLTAAVWRRDRLLRLFIPGPAAAAVRALAEHSSGEMATLKGPVFRAHGRVGRSLSYRSARAIVVAACRRAGFPVVEAAELRAGFASWLGAHGLSDHEVAEVLGLARVRSVDALRRRHTALAAQRAVRERLDR